MILISLGANLDSLIGEPAQTLRAALTELGKRDVKVAGTSPFYRTQAWPDPADPPFLNAAARIETVLEPAALLETLHAVEDMFGRVRSVQNAPRTLDLDLLDYDGRTEPGPPILPHPGIADRAFVLVPLADVAPGWFHPVTGQSILQLLARVDYSSVARL